MTSDTPEYLSTRQVAELAGVTVTTVNRWVASGKLTPAPSPFKGIRAPHLFHRDAVAAITQAPPNTKRAD